jgi:hypothetical protein
MGTGARFAHSADDTSGDRTNVFGNKLPGDEGPLTLSLAINRSLDDAGVRYPGLLIFGEDIGRKGGVYGVTRGLQRRLGPARVFDTLLDEQSIVGPALGTGISGFLPVPEVQYLAYLHNAEDQLRGEAATLSFFSQGQSTEIPWSSGSLDTAIRRASVATFTTTTQPRFYVISQVSSSPRPPGPMTPPQ